MSTLAERVKKWGDELNQQWLEKGIEQGIERGNAGWCTGWPTRDSVLASPKSLSRWSKNSRAPIA